MVETWREITRADGSRQLITQVTFYDPMGLVKPQSAVYTHDSRPDLEEEGIRIRNWECTTSSNTYKDAEGNTQFYLPGDPGESVYFINGGRVKCSKVTRDGKELTLAYRGAGQIFGELAVIDGAPREEMAEAMKNAIICTTNATMAAMSSGSPSRPTGIWARNPALTSLDTAAAMEVSMRPGAMALTVMPLEPYSQARVRVRPSSPALLTP